MRITFKLYSFIFLALMLSYNAEAARTWVGDVAVQKVVHAKANGACVPTGGPCMIIYFEEGYKSCKQISISPSDHHFETLKTYSLVSMTAKKKLSLYLSDEYCSHIQLNNINNVMLR